MIPLTRPICFIDLETTGTNTVDDRIVQIAICKLQTDGSRETKMRYVNPTIPIPAGATEIHGITDAMVADEPTFEQIAKSLHEQILGSDIGGFRSNTFDIPMLYYEFKRAKVDWDFRAVHKIDVGNIYAIKERRTLEAAVKFYCKKELENAHDAKADIEATVDVFLGQLEMYEDLPKSLDGLAKFSNYDKDWLDLHSRFITGPNGNIILNFGKHKGDPARNHPGFLEWVLYDASANFPPDVREVAKKILSKELQ